MSGYRETGFDPDVYEQPGKPLKPYNWVQWTGVALALVGIGIDLVYLGGDAGITPKLLDSPSIGIALPLLGAALINSRRQPGQPLTPERKRRNAVLILVTIAVSLAVAAAVIYFKGA